MEFFVCVGGGKNRLSGLFLMQRPLPLLSKFRSGHWNVLRRGWAVLAFLRKVGVDLSVRMCHDSNSIRSGLKRKGPYHQPVKIQYPVQ
jgi:hypothetical protein